MQRVVRIAAEGGSEVEFRLLATVTGLAEDALIETLRTAVGSASFIDGNLAESLTQLGRWADADEVLERAGGRRAVSVRTQGQIAGQRAELALARGAYEEARR